MALLQKAFQYQLNQNAGNTAAVSQEVDQLAKELVSELNLQGGQD